MHLTTEQVPRSESPGAELARVPLRVTLLLPRAPVVGNRPGVQHDFSSRDQFVGNGLAGFAAARPGIATPAGLGIALGLSAVLGFGATIVASGGGATEA